MEATRLMNRQYLLDTNVWIDIERGVANVKQKLHTLSRTQIFLSPITVAEYRLGMLKYRSAEAPSQAWTGHNFGDFTDFEKRMSSFPLLEIGGETVEYYARVRAYLESRGTPIGANDLWIAAQALENSVTLVTHNVNEFQRVPNLLVEDWRV